MAILGAIPIRYVTATISRLTISYNDAELPRIIEETVYCTILE
jgi:hypothetical protein